MTQASPKSLQDYISDAMDKISSIDAEAAHTGLSAGDLQAIDVREQAELVEQGQLPGAIHIPRGLLEFQVDPDSPFYNKKVQPGMKLVVYCGKGGRAALATQRLNAMGYEAVSLSGGFKAWVASGYDVSDYSE